MPTRARSSTGSTALGVDVLAVDLDLAVDLGARDGVVHPVDAAQEGRLAAARRADEGGDRLVRDVERDVEQRLFVAVEDGDVARGDLGRAGGPDGDSLGHAVGQAPAVQAAGSDGSSRPRAGGLAPALRITDRRSPSWPSGLRKKGISLAYHRRSKRRRSRIAAAFMTIMKASRTMMAAAVRSWKARSEAFSQM